MRFHTKHLMLFVALVAVLLALWQHPEALRAAIIPLVGGLFVVLPVLGTLEAFASVEDPRPTRGWGPVTLALIVACAGGCVAMGVGAVLLALVG